MLLTTLMRRLHTLSKETQIPVVIRHHRQRLSLYSPSIVTITDLHKQKQLNEKYLIHVCGKQN